LTKREAKLKTIVSPHKEDIFRKFWFSVDKQMRRSILAPCVVQVALLVFYCASFIDAFQLMSRPLRSILTIPTEPPTVRFGVPEELVSSQPRFLLSRRHSGKHPSNPTPSFQKKYRLMVSGAFTKLSVSKLSAMYSTTSSSSETSNKNKNNKNKGFFARLRLIIFFPLVSQLLFSKL
jgi:hypothetical protein